LGVFVYMNSLPQHIAIIMDGNGRWAQKRQMPRTVGHAKGAAGVRELVEFCANKGVKYLTLFAFSTENWSRPDEEVSALMGLFLQYIGKELKNLSQAGVRLHVIGNVTGLAQELQDRIAEAVKATAGNEGIVLTVAANYGGQWDIVQAVQRWQVEHPQADARSLTQEQLAKYLSTSHMPDPDLLIRTGGEQRISNFLVWQVVYAELYFTDVLWPEFNKTQMGIALDWFHTRKRRFGGLGEFKIKT
jgi:undecaprenyl diphosphate synthase